MARNPKKTGSPELRAIDSHDNELTEEEQAALFVKGVENMEWLIEAKDKAVTEIRNARKRMKADGFDLEDLNDALKMRKKGEEYTNKRIAAHLKIAAWLGRPFGFQASLDVGAAAE